MATHLLLWPPDVHVSMPVPRRLRQQRSSHQARYRWSRQINRNGNLPCQVLYSVFLSAPCPSRSCSRFASNWTCSERAECFAERTRTFKELRRRWREQTPAHQQQKPSLMPSEDLRHAAAPHLAQSSAGSRHGLRLRSINGLYKRVSTRGLRPCCLQCGGVAPVMTKQCLMRSGGSGITMPSASSTGPTGMPGRKRSAVSGGGTGRTLRSARLSNSAPGPSR